MVSDRVKDFEARLSAVEMGLKVLEGGSQKHSLAWNKQQTLVKARVEALEK